MVALCVSMPGNGQRSTRGYFAPTYPQNRDIFYPTIDEVAFDWGLRTKIHETNKEIHLFCGRQYRSTILCRSMEKPGEIVGFKIGKALIDELDVMKTEKAATAWRKIIARMSQPATPGLGPQITWVISTRWTAQR